MTNANLSEIFDSVQGEGIHAGKRGVFLRFAGCNLGCSYCDTEYAKQQEEVFRVYLAHETLEMANPAAGGEVVELTVRSFNPGTIVITGGEPLLQPDAVGQFARAFRSRGCLIHLETNGTLPDAFESVRYFVDSVSMDIKLPSSLGGRSLEREHLSFLKMMRAVEGSVKIVLTERATPDEVKHAADMVSGVNPHMPVLLQPAFSGTRPVIDGQALMRLQSSAAERLRDVRISVQAHKFLNVR